MYYSSSNTLWFYSIASPTLSLFHDDPYMKVMHAYYAKESHIPPPTILSLSSMLSPMFNPQEFFLPEELLPLKKRGRDRPSSSTSALPQEFGDWEKVSIANLEQIIEEDITGSSQATRGKGLQRWQMLTIPTGTPEKENTVARKCSYKEFMSCQPINFKGTEGTVGLIHWFKRTESVFSYSNYTEDCKKKLQEITRVEFKKLLIKMYCPRTEVQKMEDEFHHLTMKGNGLKAYVRRFQELATLCPTMVPDSEKMIEVFIGGLPRSNKAHSGASIE
ncbi:reverse transcriptase domain-containing protein [Tanacetum coccineum]